MNILITGAAGFIASHLIEALLPKCDFLVGIDNLETGRSQNLSAVLESRNFFYAFCDISVSESLFESIFKLADWDVVIHCAASYKNPKNWVRDVEVNCLGTTNLLELCRKQKALKRLIYLQTSLCYGLSPDSLCYGLSPDSPIKISSPISPAPNSYAITKTCAEQMIAMSGIPFVSFRLANCYGPRNLSGPIPIFFKNIVNGKVSHIVNTRRDFVYIEDLVKLIVRSVQGEGNKNYYHISTGRDYSILEIHQVMLSILGDGKYPGPSPIGKVVEKNSGDVATLLLDPSETKEDFPGWKADTSLEIGLESAIEWYKTNEINETYSHLRKD